MRQVTPTLETHRGDYVAFDRPDPETIHVDDIARALSMTCRFGGHVSRFYSVAEHALLVRHLVRQAGYPELGYAALHHDSHEAYLGDLPTPLKLVISDGYEELRICLDLAICEALSIPERDFHAGPVVEADHTALFMEASVLKHSRGVGEHWDRETESEPPPWIIGMEPAEAEASFIRAHYEEVLR